MENAIAQVNYMPNIKEKKENVYNELKEKLEVAKLNLIYTELREEGIPFNPNHQNVKNLKHDLKKNLDKLNYNKALSIIDKIEVSLTGMVEDLRKGSTNAFTKVMTSDVSKTIAKSLGITLAGRTALILAPTIGSKALIGAGMGGYSLYRIIKNRKEIIKTNENNELNNILMELEVTKENDEYIDTRFSTEIQEEIKNYLKINNIKFDNTGYRSLRQTIYNLDIKQKKGLCELLNTKLAREIDIDKRLKKAKKQLNVVSNVVSGIGVGATLGFNAATAINSIDPALFSGVLNGTFLGAWIESISNKPWLAALSGGLGLIGTEVLQYVPVIGKVAEKVFAAENLASLSVIGATGGLVVSSALAVGSGIKRIVDNNKISKENKLFLELDSQKYKDEDQKELIQIRKRLGKPTNDLENLLIDFVLGSLKDAKIDLGSIPKNMTGIQNAIENLKGKDKKKAKKILLQVYNNIKDESFVDQLKQAGRISISLFTSGLALMSVYDIIKSGAFLPELSQKIFVKENIHTPVVVPEDKDVPLEDSKLIEENKNFYDSLNTEEYLTKDNAEYQSAYGNNYLKYNNDTIGSLTGSLSVQSTRNDLALIYKLLDWIGIDISSTVPNVPKLANEISKLSPDKLLNFYRYFNSIPASDSDYYKAIRDILSYSNILEKVTTYRSSYLDKQNLHNFINSLTQKVSTGAISFNAMLEILGIIETHNSNNIYSISENELKENQEKTL